MDLQAFAQIWIDDWNSHDIERVLGHYSDDAEFRSPVAQQRTGDGIVRGKEKLRAYWEPAFTLRPDLQFALKKCFVGHQSVAIHYSDELGREVIETLVFNADGKAIFGSGCYA
jgi:ketosteroid isomerase-like protein